MDFSIPFELKMLRDSARRFTEEELIPRERAYLDAELRRGGGSEPFQAEDGVHYSDDPLGVMAESDAARIKALLVTVQTEDQAVQDLLKRTAGEQLWAGFTSRRNSRG